MRENYNYKLTKEEKDEIGAIYCFSSTKPTYHQLAEEYGVSHTLIARYVKMFKEKLEEKKEE